mmetsp:Transcript_11831/g.28704  ORF Transcript_11831/g.28704 Transcript_11831/m.28704 type:complete len:227 (-) Transcript_11831:140-820(-)
MDSRHGVPRTAPLARVSPCPSASSAYATSASLVSGCRVIRMNDTSGTTICCASMAMAAPRCPTPAAARLPTARVVYRLAHTAATAAPTTSGRAGSTLDIESYSPAADSPARSSALPDERTMMRHPGVAVKVAAIPAAASSDGRSCRTSSCSSAHTPAVSATLPRTDSSASMRKLKRWSTPAAAAAASMVPKGSTAPGGARNPAAGSVASAESCAHDAALDPARATP